MTVRAGKLGTKEHYFVETFRELLETGDLDPLYPFLAKLFERNPDLDPLWFTQLYAAYYQVDSAYQAWELAPRRNRMGADWTPLLAFPVAVERRNLRMKSRLLEHLGAIHRANEFYWSSGFDPDISWESVYNRAMSITHNGPWAAFKWTDLARYALGWKFGDTPPSVASGKGPGEGLKLLHLEHGHGLEELDVVLQLGGITEPWDRVETALCKWHGVFTGHYYVGKDIDELRRACKPFPVLAETFAETHFPLVRA